MHKIRKALCLLWLLGAPLCLSAGLESKGDALERSVSKTIYYLMESYTGVQQRVEVDVISSSGAVEFRVQYPDEKRSVFAGGNEARKYLIRQLVFDAYSKGRTLQGEGPKTVLVNFFPVESRQ